MQFSMPIQDKISNQGSVIKRESWEKKKNWSCSTIQIQLYRCPNLFKYYQQFPAREHTQTGAWPKADPYVET